VFEVEALRDGRLAGTERRCFERHLAGCADCAREVEALEALSRALRNEAPSALDELHIRRERTRLLAAFDSTLVRRREPRFGRRLAAVGLSLVLVAALLVLWRFTPGQAPVPSGGVVIQAGDGTRWSRHRHAERDRVVLEHGALDIRVDRGPGDPALTVVLPDGELEDIGTTFSVEVSGGRTRRVQVDDGSVLLKLDAQSPVTLRAGRTWVAPPKRNGKTHSLEQVHSPSSPAPPSQTSRPGVSPGRAPSRPPPAPTSSSTSSAPERAASADFRHAMAALNAGNASAAAAGFRRFVEQHPSDPRSQDAAYMRVLALDRAGDADGRRAAARSYLRRYPAGFRRSEVERLAR